MTLLRARAPKLFIASGEVKWLRADEESKAVYDRYSVPVSGRILFQTQNTFNPIRFDDIVVQRAEPGGRTDTGQVGGRPGQADIAAEALHGRHGDLLR